MGWFVLSSSAAHKILFFYLLYYFLLTRGIMMGCNRAAVASLKTLEHWQIFAHSLTYGLLIVCVQSSSRPWFAVQHVFQLIVYFILVPGTCTHTASVAAVSLLVIKSH